MDVIMNERPTKVLLAGNDQENARLLEKIFANIGRITLEWIPLEQLAEMDRHRGKNVPDVIFLDLSPADDDNLQSFLAVHNVVPEVPVIVLTETDDLPLAARLLGEGAQDCLAKDRLDALALGHSIRFALARQDSIKQLRTFSLMDELTGLYNRRGFLALAEHQLKLADRTGQSLLLAFVDVDGLKTINDLLGHQRGDLALIETAHVLKEAFRETDILARLGGDEFVALLVCSGKTQPEALIRQFRKTLEKHNSYGKRNFKLSASIGVALSDPLSPSSIGELLEKADELMYAQKNSGRRPHVVYQLRFLKSVPLGMWLKRTAALLDSIIPGEAWSPPPPPAAGRVKRLKNALASGMLTFVVRRSLCGTDSVCDLGCSPAPENKSLDRFEACVILGPAHQYLVQDIRDLKEMSERLVGAVVWELPGASPVASRIQTVLADALSAHLYENTKCLQVPLCKHSKLMDLKRELQRP
jgi:two-component system, cell cycle response regulator